MSYGTEFTRAGGEPLVLSDGSDDTAQMLVLACAGPADATGYSANRSSAGHTTQCIQKVFDSGPRSDVNKPRSQRSLPQVAAGAYEGRDNE
jgi:hypothetical protein